MDRLQAMQAFISVAEARGFAAAARKLKLSPPAITRLVAALEEHLDVRLLQRTTRSVTLTDAGARFLDRARRIVADVEEAMSIAREDRAEPSGKLVITAPLVFGRLHVGPLLGVYLDRHPRVSAELVLSDRNLNLIDEGIDVAVRIGPLADSSLIAKKVGETRRVLVASPAYLAKRPRLTKPAQLPEHALIGVSMLGPAFEWRFFDRGRELRVAVAPRYQTNSADDAIFHALRGRGLTLALSYQVEEHLASGKLRAVLSKYEPEPLPIHLVYPSSRLLSSKVRALIALFDETSSA